MATYSEALPTDSASKKFVGVVADDAGSNVMVAIRGVALAAQNTEDVADMAVGQTAHDNLNANANLQVGNADVGNANPVPVSDAGAR